MQGLTRASLMKHPSLIPLFLCVGGGGVWATYYTCRLAFKCPDVAWWNKGSGDQPNLSWPINKQYKFMSPTRDYSKETFPEERPDI